MLSAADVRRLDANSEYLGVPVSLLMENAGRAVAVQADQLAGTPPKNIVVFVGHGNNGGDGLVAARYLAQRHNVIVLLAGSEADVRSPLARTHLANLDRGRVRIEAWRGGHQEPAMLDDADVVVDAILGIGAQGELREPVRTIVQLLNAAGRKVLSVDVPTGLGSHVAVDPDVTVTFHDTKQGMNEHNSGRIVRQDIGVPKNALTDCGPGDLHSWWRPNRPDGHKGQNGRLLIVAGGPYGGAPLLASLGALRAGIDLVRLYTPKRVAPSAQEESPDLVVAWGVADDRIVPDDLPEIRKLIRRSDAVLVGPGLGTATETRETVAELLVETKRQKRPLILDADALKEAAYHRPRLKGRPVLLTPHRREFVDFSGWSLPNDPAKAWQTFSEVARGSGATILLKGPVDWISDGTRSRVNHVHAPQMTRGGTGDVLAGVAAAFVARGADPFEAACSAAFLVGETGRRVAREKGEGMLASDIVPLLANVLHEYAPGVGRD